MREKITATTEWSNKNFKKLNRIKACQRSYRPNVAFLKKEKAQFTEPQAQYLIL